MNTLEDRLHILANHLDIELRSATMQSGGSLMRDTVFDNSDSSAEVDVATPRERVRLRGVTLVAAVVVVVACVAAGVVLSRRIDDPPASGAAATGPAPSPFDGGVALIVYMRHDAKPDEIGAVRSVLASTSDVVDATKLEYLDIQATLAEAQRIFVDDPASMSLLTPDNVPTMFKVVPAHGVTSEHIEQFAQALRSLAGVLRADTPIQPTTEKPIASEATAVTATTFHEDAVPPTADRP